MAFKPHHSSKFGAVTSNRTNSSFRDVQQQSRTYQNQDSIRSLCSARHFIFYMMIYMC